MAPWLGAPSPKLNVAVAERLGAALRLSPAAATTAALPTAVRRLLDEPSFREAAGRAAALYQGVDGAARAADAILAHVDGEPSQVQPRVDAVSSPAAPRAGRAGTC